MQSLFLLALSILLAAAQVVLNDGNIIQAAGVQRENGNYVIVMDSGEKLSIPVATLVVLLFGAPLATSTRRGGTAYGIGVSLGTVMLYILLLRVSGALAQAGAVPLLPAAWTPNGLFLAGALILLVRVRT